jgi:hypothetical protein
MQIKHATIEANIFIISPPLPLSLCKASTPSCVFPVQSFIIIASPANYMLVPEMPGNLKYAFQLAYLVCAASLRWKILVSSCIIIYIL